MSDFRTESPVALCKTRWLNLFETRWSHGGAEGAWYFASRKSEPRPFPVAADAVVIAPILRQSGQPPRTLIVKEFRVPVGAWTYGFPAGLIDPGETVEQTIARELKEEAGLLLEEIVSLSPPIYSSCGMTDEAFIQAFVHVQLCPGGARPEASEAIVPMILDLDGVNRVLAANDLPFDSKCWLVLDEFRRKGAIAF